MTAKWLPPVSQPGLGSLHLSFLRFVFSKCSNFFRPDFSHSFRTTGDTFFFVFGSSKNHFHIQKNNPCLHGEITSQYEFTANKLFCTSTENSSLQIIFSSLPQRPLAHRQVFSHHAQKLQGGPSRKEPLLLPGTHPWSEGPECVQQISSASAREPQRTHSHSLFFVSHRN